MVLQLVSLWLTVTARNICLGQNEMLETHRTLKTFFFSCYDRSKEIYNQSQGTS